MTPEEKQLEIFHAASQCTSAAAEMIRSVNKPLNVTYIAQAAWDIAKKLEEMMEAAVMRDKTGAPAPTTGAILSAKEAGPVFAHTAAAHGAGGGGGAELVDFAPNNTPDARKPALAQAGAQPALRGL